MNTLGFIMQQLANKRILLGITGGIAAYKAAELVRLFKKLHADVQVVMTNAAQEFITPLTMQALSGNPVHTSLLDPEAEAGMGHIELAKWADVILVAPASADFIARLASGMGNDLLTTLCLASESPLALAPAMNQAMWKDPSCQRNIELLQDLRGKSLSIFGPAAGEQACGDTGLGRMLEPDEICEATANLFNTGLLTGKHITITAGPTREAIDPVRFISNHSSGKMGYAIAEAARDAGARVTIISGPVNLPAPERIQLVKVESAKDMLSACEQSENLGDVFIAAAAVADYRPLNVAEQKIKKSGDTIQMTLTKNPDIVATIAAKENKPFTVGFAAETQNVEEYARGKMKNKNLDMIIANDVSNQEIGFNSDHNAVLTIWPEGQQSFSQMSKSSLAKQLVELIAHQLEKTN